VDGGAGGAAPVFDVWIGLVGVEVAFALCGVLAFIKEYGNVAKWRVTCFVDATSYAFETEPVSAF
jgi:hypothetical protein